MTAATANKPKNVRLPAEAMALGGGTVKAGAIGALYRMEDEPNFVYVAGPDWVVRLPADSLDSKAANAPLFIYVRYSTYLRRFRLDVPPNELLPIDQWNPSTIKWDEIDQIDGGTDAGRAGYVGHNSWSEVRPEDLDANQQGE